MRCDGYSRIACSFTILNWWCRIFQTSFGYSSTQTNQWYFAKGNIQQYVECEALARHARARTSILLFYYIRRASLVRAFYVNVSSATQRTRNVSWLFSSYQLLTYLFSVCIAGCTLLLHPISHLRFPLELPSKKYQTTLSIFTPPPPFKPHFKDTASQATKYYHVNWCVVYVDITIGGEWNRIATVHCTVQYLYVPYS